MKVNVFEKKGRLKQNEYEIYRKKKMEGISNNIVLVKNLILFSLFLLLVINLIYIKHIHNGLSEEVIMVVNNFRLDGFFVPFTHHFLAIIKWVLVYFFYIYILIISIPKLKSKVQEIVYKYVSINFNRFDKLLIKLIPVFIISFIFAIKEVNFSILEKDFSGKYLLVIFISILLNNFFSCVPYWISHKKLVIRVTAETSEKYNIKLSSRSKGKRNRQINWLTLVFFPTLHYAKCYKNKLEYYLEDFTNYKCYNPEICFKRKLYKEDIVERCECFWETLLNQKRDQLIFNNWLNLIMVILLFIFYGYARLSVEGIIVDIFLVTFILHFFSRSIEIAYSFYSDVVKVRFKIFRSEHYIKVINEWRDSSLQKSTRISLAFHSLIEVIVSFVIIYIAYIHFFSQFPNTDIELYQNLSLNIYEYYSLLIYSTSVSMFNVSLVSTSNNPIALFIHLWQVGMSMNLIVLSLASYLGMNNNITEREAVYFYDLYKNQIGK